MGRSSKTSSGGRTSRRNERDKGHEKGQEKGGSSSRDKGRRGTTRKEVKFEKEPSPPVIVRPRHHHPPADGSDLQSWNEVPSIAHFCSLFRQAFDLLEFDIQELEESLLLMNSEDDATQLVQRLVIKLLKGCSKTFTNNINEDNYNTYLRRLFLSKREDAEEDHLEFHFDCKALLDDDIDFQDLSLRNRVRILHQLCELRLEAEDVFDKLKNLDASSLRVDPLGKNAEGTTYWYFYGTRLYKEERSDDKKSSSKKSKEKDKKKKKKDKKKKKKKKSNRGESASSAEDDDIDTRPRWSVACLTLQDWEDLTEKYKKSKKKSEKELYETLSESFLPEIVKMFAEKEREERRRMLMMQPKRISSRIERKKQEQEERDRVLAEKLEEERRLEEEYDEKLKLEREKQDEDERERSREERVKQREAMKELRAQRIAERDVKLFDDKDHLTRPRRGDPVYTPTSSAVDSEDEEESKDSTYTPPSLSELRGARAANANLASNTAKTNFTNALLRVGTRATKDSTLDKPVRKSPGLLLETAGRSLLQRAHTGGTLGGQTNKPGSGGSSMLSSGATAGGLSFGLASSKISFGLYGGHLPVDHGSYTKTGRDSPVSADEAGNNAASVSDDEAKMSKSKVPPQSRQKVFSNWGGEFFKKNLDYRANTNKILEKMNLNFSGGGKEGKNAATNGDSSSAASAAAPPIGGLRSLVTAAKRPHDASGTAGGSSGQSSPAKKLKASFLNSYV